MLPWSCIIEALKNHNAPAYLRHIIANYLAVSYVSYQGRDEHHRREMSSGVPQGSVLGLLLWNIGYVWVLRGDSLPNVFVLRYADDTLVAARGKSHRKVSIAGQINVY